MKYLISAGHNPAKKEERGVVIGQHIESVMAEETAKLVVEKLQSAGYNAVFVPNNLTLAEEIEWVNKKSSPEDVALQYHYNSHPSSSVRGTETFYYRNQILAEIFARHISKALEIPNNGHKPDEQSYLGELGWVRKTKCKAVLIESCFLTNSEDVKSLNYAKIAEGTLNAIKEIDTPVVIVDETLKTEVITERKKSFLEVLFEFFASLFRKKKLGAIEKEERSLTIKASWINIAVAVAGIMGVQLTSADINGFWVVTEAAITIVLSLLVWFGRWRAGGVDALGRRL